VAKVDFAKCRACKNGARPNMYHPSGEPDRLAAICVRTCMDKLERQGQLDTDFQTPFRGKPAWALDATGRRIGAGGEA
jgi:hypothetical protein